MGSSSNQRPDNISLPESEPEIIRITKDFDLKAILTEQLQTNSDTEKKYALTEFSCALSWKRNFLPVQNPHIYLHILDIPTRRFCLLPCTLD